MKRLSHAVSLVLAATLCAASASASQSLVRLRPGPLLDALETRFQRDARETADPSAWRYLSKAVKGAIQTLETAHGFRATHGYSAVMQGFAADLTKEQIESLRLDPLVESITISVSMSPTDDHAVPWGIGRVGAQPSAASSGVSPIAGVRGVTVYVIDSGIDRSNQDLNLTRHVNFAGGPNTDCNGHGTHVAGTIGARDNDIGVTGVAPGVALVGVKVVDCSGNGSSASLLKGIDWVVATAVHPAVINLSLGGGESPPLDAAVQVAAASGILFVIAAGNNATDACLASPSLNGSSSGIVTVAAVDANELEPAFSNFGGCVDLWAPGVSIASTASGPTGAPLTLSGTSMAAPHVAGAAALFLARNPTATPGDVEAALIASSYLAGTASKDGRTVLRLRIAGESSY